MKIWERLKRAAERFIGICEPEEKTENKPVKAAQSDAKAQPDICADTCEKVTVEQIEQQEAAEKEVREGMEMALRGPAGMTEEEIERDMKILEAVIAELGRKLQEASKIAAELMETLGDEITEVMEQICESEKRREELRMWHKYYKARESMTNNYRRRHNIPMVRRPRGRRGRKMKPPARRGNRKK